MTMDKTITFLFLLVARKKSQARLKSVGPLWTMLDRIYCSLYSSNFPTADLQFDAEPFQSSGIFSSLIVASSAASFAARKRPRLILSVYPIPCWLTFPRVGRIISALYSDESDILHQRRPPSLSYTNSLKFSSRSFTVRAFFNDILLVSDRSHPCTTYYICNPLTRKFVALPDAPQRCTIFFQIPLDSIMVGLDWYGMHNRRAMLRLQSSSYHYSQRFQSIRFNLSFLLWLQNGRCSWFLLPSGSILIFEPSIFRWLCLPMGCYSG